MSEAPPPYGPAFDWSEPCTTMTGWEDQLVAGYERVLELLAPFLGDALTDRHWRACRDRLDALRPTTVAEVNAGWVYFVVAVWQTRDAAVLRRWQQARARA